MSDHSAEVRCVGWVQETEEGVQSGNIRPGRHPVARGPRRPA